MDGAPITVDPESGVERRSMQRLVRLPPVLDACCGSRMMWFDGKDARAIFMDRDERTYIKDKGTDGTNGRMPIIVAPDVKADFTEMPFPDDSFWHVVFDPPHYTDKSLTPQSCLAACFGMLLPGWEEMLEAGFRECFRVLKPNGTLIFKWCSTEIPLSRVLALAPEKPLYGHRSGKKAQTHWVAFCKPNVPHDLSRTAGTRACSAGEVPAGSD